MNDQLPPHAAMLLLLRQSRRNVTWQYWLRIAIALIAFLIVLASVRG